MRSWLWVLTFGVASGCFPLKPEHEDDDSCSGTAIEEYDGGVGVKIESENDLEEIAHCVDYSGILYISEQDWLTDIDLPLLETVDGMEIGGNDALTHFDGLSNLNKVTNTLGIYRNDALTSLEGLSSLQTVGALYLHSNESLCQDDAEDFATALGLDVDSDGDGMVTGNEGDCD